MSATYIIKSNIESGEKGYFLVCALILSLKNSNNLEDVHLNHSLLELKECDITEVQEELPFLMINDKKYMHYDSSLYADLYREYCPDKEEIDIDVLNLWLRAGSVSADTVASYYRDAIDKNIIARVIAKGGNLMAALNL